MNRERADRRRVTLETEAAADFDGMSRAVDDPTVDAAVRSHPTVRSYVERVLDAAVDATVQELKELHKNGCEIAKRDMDRMVARINPSPQGKQACVTMINSVIAGCVKQGCRPTPVIDMILTGSHSTYFRDGRLNQVDLIVERFSRECRPR